MKQNFLQKSLFTVFLLAVALVGYSVPPPPPPPAPPAGVPIDGGFFLLLGAGLVYGARKLYRE